MANENDSPLAGMTLLRFLRLPERERERLVRIMLRDTAPPRPIVKLDWSGRVTSVQPRIRLTRSFDQRSHTYLGYSLRVDGKIGQETREVWVGIGKAAQAKHQFRFGVHAEGVCVPVADPRKESVEFYRASKLRICDRSAGAAADGPPWHGLPPDLATYRERGHRRLSARTYKSKCSGCIWGAEMAVEMILDQWDPSKRRFRTETFCYGPKSCRLYSSGPPRRVPGRKGMSYTEEDWVDEEATAHRASDD